MMDADAPRGLLWLTLVERRPRIGERFEVSAGSELLSCRGRVISCRTSQPLPLRLSLSLSLSLSRYPRHY